MKNREFDIIFTFYGNDEGTIYGLVYKNTDAFCQLMNIALDWSYELKGDPVNGGLEVLEIEQKKIKIHLNQSITKSILIQA